MNRHRRLALLGVSLALAASGCTVGPNFRLPFLNLPKTFGEPQVVTPDAPLVVPANWWRLYRDPMLDDLVATGLSRNVDVRLAIARIEEAEAFAREIAAASLFPLVEGEARGSRARSSTRTGTLPASSAPIRNAFTVAASTAFELDFWGRLRRGREAARAQLAATRYASDVVALSLAAAIARTYFAVRSLDAQIRVSEEILTAASDTLDIAHKRARAGLVSDLDVNQSEANRAQLAVQLNELRRVRAATVHQLGVLSGILDLAVEPGDIRAVPAPPLPPAGLPSSLLERRPDLREAAANYEAANAQIGVARAAQFPTVSLTGAFGAQSQALSNLTGTGARIWSIGVNAAGPVFDAGLYAARTQQAEARARQSALVYEKTAETAFREVADALSNVRLAADAENDLQLRLDQSRNALRLSSLRYESGYSGYLEVLDAQRTVNDAQLTLLRNRQQFLAYTVDLMNALGGGWLPPK